jgi:hypothetical protein
VTPAVGAGEPCGELELQAARLREAINIRTRVGKSIFFIGLPL